MEAHANAASLKIASQFIEFGQRVVRGEQKTVLEIPGSFKKNEHAANSTYKGEVMESWKVESGRCNTRCNTRVRHSVCVCFKSFCS